MKKDYGSGHGGRRGGKIDHGGKPGDIDRPSRELQGDEGAFGKRHEKDTAPGDLRKSTANAGKGALRTGHKSHGSITADTQSDDKGYA